MNIETFKVMIIGIWVVLGWVGVIIDLIQRKKRDPKYKFSNDPNFLKGLVITGFMGPITIFIFAKRDIQFWLDNRKGAKNG